MAKKMKFSMRVLNAIDNILKIRFAGSDLAAFALFTVVTMFFYLFGNWILGTIWPTTSMTMTILYGLISLFVGLIAAFQSLNIVQWILDKIGI